MALPVYDLPSHCLKHPKFVARKKITKICEYMPFLVYYLSTVNETINMNLKSILIRTVYKSIDTDHLILYIK